MVRILKIALIIVLLSGIKISAQNYNMGNLGTISDACGGNFYDSQGPGTNYLNNEFYTATFCAPPGQYISFNFTAFQTEFLFDWLDVYNGPTTGSPLIGSYTGAAGPGLITSSLGGCITFVFESDGAQRRAGWEATITCSTTPPSTGNDCDAALPFCTSSSYTFPNNTNQPNLGSVDCLLSTPNPVWYYMQIANPGNLNMNISQTDGFGFPIDVDFDLFGPFTSASNGCAAIFGGTANSVDCSYSPSASEVANIVGAQTGEFYILLLTNYSNDAGTINFSVAGGSTASTNCAILCDITDVTANPGACSPATNTYAVTGQVSITNPPTTGSLVISTSCGGSTTINAPFGATVNYTINGINASGGNCNVSATFTADATCNFIQSYTAPVSCASTVLNCPTYASISTSPNQACAGQVYYLDVANTACNGTITMNVVGNYGSQDANEITWQVTSNLTGGIVASGGPGTNGGAINTTVGPLNPAIFGTIFTLIVYDSWGDGFNGVGGILSVLQNGNVVGGPILPGLWANSSVIFGANISISPATISITTPTGLVSSTVTGCNNFHVPLSLQNSNFCNTVNINLPWTVTCQSTGALLSSGNNNVTIYPSIPSAASDLVDITFNSATCQWSVSPKNDCVAANIGSIFTISPNPATLTSAACTGGNQTFNVTYNGISGGPNCCSTGGPLIPIIYNQSFPTSNAVVSGTPFGGTNNAALITIPPNNIGGNATSLTLDINISGYCFNQPGPNAPVNTNYWVTIIVDGQIVYDQSTVNPGPANYNVSINLATLPNGYNQNSTIQIYTYPNAFNFGGTFTTFNPIATCPIPNGQDGQWTAQINTAINATFSDLMPTPGVCNFSPFLPYFCCSSTPVTDASAAICSGDALTNLTTWQNAVTSANTTCVVYSSVLPVAGSVLPDNIVPNGINLTASPISQVVSAYSYCDVDGSATINVGDTYTLISTFTLTVNPVPTATIAGTTSICNGTSTSITFTGTSNATITYTINGGANQTIVLDASGNATLATGNLITNTTYALVSASLVGPPVCGQNLTGTAVVTIALPLPTSISYPGSPFCINFVGNVNPIIIGILGGSFSSNPAGLTITGAGVITPSTSLPGTYIVTYLVPAASGCAAYNVTETVVIEALPSLPTLLPNPACAGVPLNFVAGGGSLYEFTLNGVSQGAPTATNTIALGPLISGDIVCVNSYPTLPINFNGLITETEWGNPLSTSANGPTASGFGVGNNLDALFLKNSSGYLYGALAGNLVNGSNNRILLFIDCQPGGFNNLGAWVARNNAPYYSIENLNNITFDAGFSPEYILAMNQATGDSYFDLYNMVTNTNNYLGNGLGSPLLGFIGNAGTGDYANGFEFGFPLSAIGSPTVSVKVFAMLVNNPGTQTLPNTTISNQFLTPCGSAELNYGNGTVNFAAAAPNPIQYPLSADCFSQICVTVVNTIVPTFSFPLNFCSGAIAPILPLISDNGISGTWSASVINNTINGSYTFTPSGGCATPITINITVDPNAILSPIYHD